MVLVVLVCILEVVFHFPGAFLSPCVTESCRRLVLGDVTTKPSCRSNAQLNHRHVWMGLLMRPQQRPTSIKALTVTEIVDRVTSQDQLVVQTEACQELHVEANQPIPLLEACICSLDF